MDKDLFFLGSFVTLSLGITFFALGIDVPVNQNNLTGGLFFVPSITEDELLSKYARTGNSLSPKIRVLIVPGHDDNAWGTEYREMQEAELNLALSKKLKDYFNEDPAFEAFSVRESGWYEPWFLSYTINEQASIVEFRKKHVEQMQNFLDAGLIHERQEVYHNDAPADTVLRLYAINKWANENNVDLVIHVHFNDYPDRKWERLGKYSGFSIYIPEKQFSNAKASKAIAESVHSHLSIYFHESNMPKEVGGLIEDQELIAVGAFNTLDSAALLLEYAYIYESPLHNLATRNELLSHYARETFTGIKSYFEKKQNETTLYDITLPKATLQKTKKVSAEILRLQLALSSLGFYPPQNVSKNDCPPTGIFGPCTEKAIIIFQKAHNITPASGIYGAKTREALSNLLLKIGKKPSEKEIEIIP